MRDPLGFIISDIAYKVSELERKDSAVDSMADGMARLLCGRLRKVHSSFILSRLKRELKDFNSNTGEWKDDVYETEQTTTD